jgi:hypothetical protein
MKLKADVRGGGGISNPIGAMRPATRIELDHVDDHFFLHRFDQDGESVGDTWHETLEAAKAQAKEALGVQESDWKVGLKVWDYDAIAKGPDLRGAIQDVPDTGSRLGETSLEWSVRMLLKHLQALAADAETMLLAYPAKCAAIDELVNDFALYLESSKPLIKEGMVSHEYLDKAHRVDQKITEMSERHDPKLWTNDALRDNLEWEEVRRLAKEALAAMGYDLEPPPPGSL